MRVPAYLLIPKPTIMPILSRGWMISMAHLRIWNHISGVAFIFADIFDEFTLQLSRSSSPAPTSDSDELEDANPFLESPVSHRRSNSKQRQKSKHKDDEDHVDGDGQTTLFQIHLNILIECLNIFGTAGPMAAPLGAANNFKKWKRDGDEEEADREGGEREREGVGRREVVGEKGTSMRMSYAGEGYPLTLLM